MSIRPKVVIVGGPDVDARLDLMNQLRDDFDCGALGSDPALIDRFSNAGFDYNHYYLNRQANPLSDLLTVRQLMFLFRQLQPHIVHAFDTKPGVWGCLAARLANVPVIVGTSTGLGSLYAGVEIKTRLLWLVYQQLQTWACRVSDLTIFQNHTDLHALVALGVVPQQKAKVILGSGVATDVFASDQVSQEKRNRLRRELEIQPEDFVVTMISRVMRSKGVLEFVSAAQNVSSRRSSIRFLLVGPEEEESLDSLTEIELAQLQQRVCWPGARQDIPAILAISDIFVLPTFYREGIPRVLLEAAAMELPIVTTDTPGCNELVENEVNGFLIPGHNSDALAQSVLHLIERPDLRQRFGRISRERVEERFSLTVIAEQTRRVYQQLLVQKELVPESVYQYQALPKA